MYLVAWLFLTETLQKKKHGGEDDTETSLPSTSEDSGIELIGQAASEYTSQVEMDSDTEILQIAESDVDSSTDIERIGSDVELLVHHTHRIELHNPFQSLVNLPQSCAVLICLQCRGEVNLCEAIGRRLKSAAAKLWSTVLLLRDRSVLISTSLYGFLSFIAIVGTVVCPMLDSCAVVCLPLCVCTE